MSKLDDYREKKKVYEVALYRALDVDYLGFGRYRMGNGKSISIAYISNGEVKHDFDENETNIIAKTLNRMRDDILMEYIKQLEKEIGTAKEEALEECQEFIDRMLDEDIKKLKQETDK